MASSASVSSSSIYSQVTSALASRIPVLNQVVRRRTNTSVDLPSSQQTQSRTRSYSSLSTDSVDSNATTIIASGRTTPNTAPEDLTISRVISIPKNAQSRSAKEQASIASGKNVDRDTARAGVTLATTALTRLDIDTTDISARGMYIDAVKYMVRALPEDLSDTERITLDIAPTANMHLQTLSRQQKYSSQTTSTPYQTRTSKMIRASSARIVNLLLSAFFSLIMLGIPIFALLFTRAVEYERRHRLSEKAVESTRSLAGTASTTLVRASKSRSGAYCLATILGVVQSILEGAGDGINKSTVEFGTRLPG